MKKTLITFSLFILIFSTKTVFDSTAYSNHNNTLNSLLREYNISFGANGSLPVTRDFKFPSNNKVFHTIISQEKDLRIEIEIIKPLQKEESIKFSKSKYIILQSLFEPQIIPYSGALTHTSDCPDDKKPEEIMLEILGKPEKVLLTNATERYVLGVCDDDLIQQKSAFVVLFDEVNKTLYQITIFKPSSSFNRIMVLNILKSLKRI